MLHFRMDMPLYLMAFYGSIMILAVLLIRVLFKRRLPQFVFPRSLGARAGSPFDPIFPVQPDQCACFGAADAIHRKRSDCSGGQRGDPERMFRMQQSIVWLREQDRFLSACSSFLWFSFGRVWRRRRGVLIYQKEAVPKS